MSDPRGGTAAAQRAASRRRARGRAVPQPRARQAGRRPRRSRGKIALSGCPGRSSFVPITELTRDPERDGDRRAQGHACSSPCCTTRAAGSTRARFYDGPLHLQAGQGRGRRSPRCRLTDGTLAELRRKRRPAGRSSVAARVAAKKPALRRRSGSLWGDGRGRFRTRGRYGAATVRGTKWLTRRPLRRHARPRRARRGRGQGPAAPEEEGQAGRGRRGAVREEAGRVSGSRCWACSRCPPRSAGAEPEPERGRSVVLEPVWARSRPGGRPATATSRRAAGTSRLGVRRGRRRRDLRRAPRSRSRAGASPCPGGPTCTPTQPPLTCPAATTSRRVAAVQLLTPVDRLA